MYRRYISEDFYNEFCKQFNLNSFIIIPSFKYKNNDIIIETKYSIPKNTIKKSQTFNKRKNNPIPGRSY